MVFRGLSVSPSVVFRQPLSAPIIDAPWSFVVFHRQSSSYTGSLDHANWSIELRLFLVYLLYTRIDSICWLAVDEGGGILLGGWPSSLQSDASLF